MQWIKRNLLRKLWPLVLSTLTFAFFFWQYLVEGSIGSKTSALVAFLPFLGSLYGYLFYRPSIKPKLSIEMDGKGKQRSSPLDMDGTPVKRVIPGHTYDYPVKYNYLFMVRNNSANIAVNPKFHLLDKYSGLVFDSLNRRKPIKILRFDEIFVEDIDRVRNRVAMIAGKEYAITASYEKRIRATRESIEQFTVGYFPKEFHELEILVEYENEEGDKFFTLLKRKANGDVVEKIISEKPFRYSWLGRILLK